MQIHMLLKHFCGSGKHMKLFKYEFQRHPTYVGFCIGSRAARCSSTKEATPASCSTMAAAKSLCRGFFQEKLQVPQ